MSTQPPMTSIFHRVATNENDYTELLCNLMKRSKEFRAAVILKLLGDTPPVPICAEDIKTQVVLSQMGRPDVVIDSANLRAIIEVKLDPRRGCTDYQLPPEDEVLTGYGKFLGRGEAKRVLSFLVPGNWKHLSETQDRLVRFGKKHPSLCAKIIRWEEIFMLLDKKHFSADPLLVEFKHLLRADFGPIELEVKEIEMATTGKQPTAKCFNKMSHIVDAIANKCKGSYVFDGPSHDKLGEGYGLQFYKEEWRHNKNREMLFWFGIWSPFWDNKGKALSFGITHDMAAEVESFRAACSGQTEEYSEDDSGSLKSKWELGSIPASDLESDDPVTEIWLRLEPILRKMYAAASRKD